MSSALAIPHREKCFPGIPTGKFPPSCRYAFQSLEDRSATAAIPRPASRPRAQSVLRSAAFRRPLPMQNTKIAKTRSAPRTLPAIAPARARSRTTAECLPEAVDKDDEMVAVESTV